MPDGTQQQGGRVPPSDLDSEAAVLSACLLDPRECVDDLRALLHPQHFYADANRRIYEAVLELDSEGKPVDAVLVAGRLRDQNRLQQVGGTPYIAQLSDATPAVAHVVDHAKVIVEKARQRQVIAVCQRFATEGYGDVGDPREWAQTVAQALTDVAASGEEDEPAELMSELVPREMNAIRERAARQVEISGIATKLTVFDKQTGGLTEGKLHVLGGRPGMGKTSFALQLAINVAEQGLGVVFVSAEMDKLEIVRKALALEGRVDHSKVKSGLMQRPEWVDLAEGAQRLRGLPLSLRWRAGATVGLVRSTVRKEQRRLLELGVPKLGLVVVDYMQLLDGERRQGESREQEVSRISQRLTWMAGEFKVPVLALSQLNRSVESRANRSKRPGMSDLRESGSIEQDAYTITLLYRDEYYNKGSRHKGVLEANVAKNRGGPEGRVYLRFTAEYGRIDNLAADYEYGGDYEDQDA